MVPPSVLGTRWEIFVGWVQGSDRKTKEFVSEVIVIDFFSRLAQESSHLRLVTRVDLLHLETRIYLAVEKDYGLRSFREPAKVSRDAVSRELLACLLTTIQNSTLFLRSFHFFGALFTFYLDGRSLRRDLFCYKW
ncbi:hypothetical protein M408DRAFT_159902 [Serendipita vermifera MAFF 305830]|uniref:Uncharacterized protein n=1 Tax=Serendipita vermifera MAFF 305830 TaxID=933852 RepID=A0A0C2WNM7_SERVB|nr:hypothetical protein M408DRAFT_159902 [Serendipita vermifera MAFF 305830]